MGKFSIENLSEFLGKSILKLKANIEEYKPINLSGKEEIYSNGCSHEEIKCLVKYGEKVAICFKNSEEFQKTRNASISGGKLKLKGVGRRKLDLNSIKIIDEIKNSLDLKNKICKLPEEKNLPDINIASLCEQLGLEGNLIDCTRKKVEGTSNQEIKSSGISQYEFYVNSEERNCSEKLRYFKKGNKIVLAFLNGKFGFKLKKENEILSYKKVNLDTILKLEETDSNKDIFRQVHDLKLTELISRELKIEFNYSEVIGEKLYKLISKSKVKLYVNEKKEVFINTLEDSKIENIEIKELEGLDRYSTFYEKVIKEGIIRSKDIDKVLEKLDVQVNIKKKEIERYKIYYEEDIEISKDNRLYMPKDKDERIVCIIKSSSEIEAVKGNLKTTDGCETKFFNIINCVDNVEVFDPLILTRKKITYKKDNENYDKIARENINFIVEPTSKLSICQNLLNFDNFELKVSDADVRVFVYDFNKKYEDCYLERSPSSYEEIKKEFELYVKDKFNENRDLFNYNIELNKRQGQEIESNIKESKEYNKFIANNHIKFKSTADEEGNPKPFGTGSNLPFDIKYKFYSCKDVNVDEISNFELYDLGSNGILITKPYNDITDSVEFLKFFNVEGKKEIELTEKNKDKFLNGKKIGNRMFLIRTIVDILGEEIKDKEDLKRKFKDFKFNKSKIKFILDKLVSLEAIDEDVEKEILEEKEAEGNDGQGIEAGQDGEGEIGAEADVLPEDAGKQQQMTEADDPNGSNDGIGEGEKEILDPEQLKQEADQEVQVKLGELGELIGENESKKEGEK